MGGLTRGLARSLTRDLQAGGTLIRNLGGGDADPLFNDVSILLPFDVNGEDFSSNDLAAVSQGTPIIETTGQKWGDGCLDTNGGSNGYRYADSAVLDLGAGEFTIETWAYMPALTNCSLFSKGSTSDQRSYMIGHINSGALGFFFRWSTNGSGNNGDLYSAIAGTASTWHHVAVVREGNTFRIYVDGVQGNTGNATGVTLFDSSSPLYTYGAGLYTQGDHWLDDLRITKGQCRYPGGTTFVPPAGPFPTSG